MTPLAQLLARYEADGILRHHGQRDGIDIWIPLKHPWMMTNDPNRPCDCGPQHDPTCEAADDD